MGLSGELSTRIGIGTVQFGLDYGISNTTGKTSLDEIKKILDFAAVAGINLLDTAPAYGVSEQSIGVSLPTNNPFSIVTKTPVLNDVSDINRSALLFKNMFQQSLDSLKCSSIYGLLVHRVEDLFVHDSERLWAVMEELKAKKSVSKIGVSVYNGEQIDKIIGRFPIDIIQVPINVFDQRLIRSGHLTMLKSMGIEIHVRSVFLQGLLLMHPPNLPAAFESVSGLMQRYHQKISGLNISPIQSALNFVASLPTVDKIICGVNNSNQLKELCIFGNGVTAIDYDEFACDDDNIINPSRWKLK